MGKLAYFVQVQLNPGEYQNKKENVVVTLKKGKVKGGVYANFL